MPAPLTIATSRALLGGAYAQQQALSSLLRTQAAGIWKFENGGALGTDTTANGNNLTNNNSVSQVSPGKIGNAGGFVSASSQSLTLADSASLSCGAGVLLTVALWAYLATTSPTDQRPLGKWGSSGQDEYMVRFNTNRFEFWTFDSLGTPHTAVANTFGAPTTATWYFIVGQYDGTNTRISVNNGAFDSVAGGADIKDSTATFSLGSDTSSSDNPVNWWNGQLDEVLVIKRVLTALELTTLYNSGAGMAL